MNGLLKRIACVAMVAVAGCAGWQRETIVRQCWFRPGAGAGDGSAARPFGTLADVRAFVRAAVDDAALPEGLVEVVVKDGRYPLTATVEIGEQDAGTARHPVRWRAETRGGVRFTGGRPLPPLGPVTGPERERLPAAVRDRVRVADLAQAGFTRKNVGLVRSDGSPEPWASAELVWKGRLQTLARWPNEGYVGIASTPPTGVDKSGTWRHAYEFVPATNHVWRWADEPDPHGNGFFCFNWAASRIAFRKIDPAKGKLEQKYARGYGASKHGYWYGFNLFCELDAGGEYYIDRENLKLYFLPPEGETDPQAEVTCVTDLFRLRNVSYLTCDGFVFENGRGNGLEIHGGHHLQIVGCTLRGIGRRAIFAQKLREARIAGCDISYCGEGGVTLFGGKPQTLEHANVSVENCHIHHFSESELAYHHAVRWQGCGFRITHCTIHDGPHAALLFFGREHEISHNEIHSVCLECGEIGAIYAGRDWTLCGNVITGNWIHDIYNPRNERNRGIMLDDGAAGFTMTLNRFERVAEGISLSGIGNRVENNVFVSNFPPVSCWQNWSHPGDLTNPRCSHVDLTNHLAKIRVHEEPWASRYPYLGMIDDAIRNNTVRDPATRTVIRDNWAYDGGGFTNFPHRPWHYTPETWDISRNAINVREAPAWTRRLPDISEIGCQETPERATWPVSHPVTIKCADLVYVKRRN